MNKKIRFLLSAAIMVSLSTADSISVLAVPQDTTTAVSEQSKENTSTENANKVEAVNNAEAIDNGETSLDADSTQVDEEKTKKIQEVISNIQEYDNNIELKTAKLKELQNKLDLKEQEIKENENNIELLTKKAEDTDKALGQRLKEMNANGSIKASVLTYINAILKSGNILDAVNKVQMISKVCQNDAKIIEEAKNAKNDLETTKAKIEKEKKQLEEDKKYIEDEIKKLEDEKTKLVNYIKENSDLISLSGGTVIPVTLPSDYSESVKKLINEAQKYLGIPYLWGGTTPAGFDCSGLMQYVYNSQGISIPRTSQEQQKAAEPIEFCDLKPGDLVFNKAQDATHVGMYIGNDMYIQAPHTGDFVKISRLSTSNMKFAGRVADFTDKK